MAAQRGDLFLIETNTTGSTYVGISSARSTDWTINNSQVDVTTITSGTWKSLLQSAGIQDMAISLSGVWEDSVQEKVFVTAVTGNTIIPLKFTNGNGDGFAGNFAVTSYKRAGTYNGEETYTVSLASSGAVTYTPGT